MPDPSMDAIGAAWALVILVLAVPVILFAMVRDARLKRSAAQPPPSPAAHSAPSAPAKSTTNFAEQPIAPQTPSPTPVELSTPPVDFGERVLAGMAALKSGVLDVAIQAGETLTWRGSRDEHRDAGLLILRGAAATGDRLAIRALRSAVEPESIWDEEYLDWDPPSHGDTDMREPLPREVEYDAYVSMLFVRHDRGDLEATFELSCLGVRLCDEKDGLVDYLGLAAAQGHAGAKVCLAAQELESSSRRSIAAIKRLRAIVASNATTTGVRAAATLRLLEHFAPDFCQPPSDEYLALRQRAIDLGQTRAMISYARGLNAYEPGPRRLARAMLERAALAGDHEAMASLHSLITEHEAAEAAEAAEYWKSECLRRRGYF